jgi:hypothetical protein
MNQITARDFFGTHTARLQTVCRFVRPSFCKDRVHVLPSLIGPSANFRYWLLMSEKGPAVRNKRGHSLVVGECYAFPASGEGNARYNWPTKPNRERNYPSLVDAALESASYLSSLQDSRMDTRASRREYPEVCGRCLGARHSDISAPGGDLQNLRSFDVFQRSADWRRHRSCSPTTAASKCFGTGRSRQSIRFIWKLSTFESAQTDQCARGFVKEKIERWQRPDQLRETFRPVRQCGPDIWGAQ